MIALYNLIIIIVFIWIVTFFWVVHIYSHRKLEVYIFVFFNKLFFYIFNFITYYIIINSYTSFRNMYFATIIHHITISMKRGGCR